MSEPSKFEWQGKTTTFRTIVLGCLAAIAILLGLAGLFLSLIWVLGLASNPEIEPWHLWTGGGLTIIMSAVAVIMGESLIEDIVKFALIAMGAPLILSALGPCSLVIYLGAVVGLSIPLLLRAFGRG